MFATLFRHCSPLGSPAASRPGRCCSLGAVVVFSWFPLGMAAPRPISPPRDLGCPGGRCSAAAGWGKRASWAHQNLLRVVQAAMRRPACWRCWPRRMPAGDCGGWLASAAACRLHRRLCGQCGRPLRGLCWLVGLLWQAAVLYGEGPLKAWWRAEAAEAWRPWCAAHALWQSAQGGEQRGPALGIHHQHAAPFGVA